MQETNTTFSVNDSSTAKSKITKKKQIGICFSSYQKSSDEANPSQIAHLS